MRPTKYKKPLSFYAEKWGTTTTTASSYARRGCNWDNDFEAAIWLLKYTRRRTPAMRKAIYAVPGIDDPFAPTNPVTIPKRSGEIDCHAFGRLMTLCCDTEAAVAKLKHGENKNISDGSGTKDLTRKEALRLRREVAKLEAMTAKLGDENVHL